MVHATTSRAPAAARPASPSPAEPRTPAAVPSVSPSPAEPADPHPVAGALTDRTAPADHAEPGDGPTSPPPPSPLLARRRARRRALVAVTVVVGLLATGLVIVDLWLWSTPQDGPSVEEISQALADTAVAQEALHDVRGGYSADQGDLVQVGWLPASGIDVTVVSAGADTYCLAAGPAGSEPVAWLTQDWTPLTEPCE